MSKRQIIKELCAVLLITSSIALVAYQVVDIDDVSTGLLYYVAQAFLLAGSIFGLDYYVHLLGSRYDNEKRVAGHAKQ